jgi:hypothetical protein
MLLAHPEKIMDVFAEQVTVASAKASIAAGTFDDYTEQVAFVVGYVTATTLVKTDDRSRDVSIYPKVYNAYAELIVKPIRHLLFDKEKALLAVSFSYLMYGCNCALVANGVTKVYTIKKDLCTALRNTKLRGLTMSDIKLPRYSTLVHLEDDDTWCVIADYNADCMLTGESATSAYTYFFYKGVVDNNWRKFQIHANKDLEEVYDIVALGGAPAGPIAEYLDLPQISADVNIKVRNTTAAVNNALLYITNNDFDIEMVNCNDDYTKLVKRLKKGVKNSGKLRRRLQNTQPNTVGVVGGSYVLNRSTSSGSGDGQGDRHISVRYVVSGHWRHQACGVGLTDRRLMWIQPHWKGPEWAPITAKTCIVTKPVPQIILDDQPKPEIDC